MSPGFNEHLKKYEAELRDATSMSSRLREIEEEKSACNDNINDSEQFKTEQDSKEWTD